MWGFLSEVINFEIMIEGVCFNESREKTLKCV